MIFYLDENFPKAACQLLEKYGHQWHDHRGTVSEGMEDAALLQAARNLDAVLLSTDRDFYHSFRPVADEPGAIVIALKQPNRESILKRLEWVLSNISEESLRGRVFQLRDQTVVMRPPMQAEFE